MMEEKLVLVSGASGYLASWCIKLLLERGYRVRGTVRSLKNPQKVDPVRKLEPTGKRLELVEADLMKDDTWPKAVKGCDYVLHVASPLVVGGSQKTVDTAIQGATSVLKACGDELSVKKVVLTSSSLAICDGHNPPKEYYDENDWTYIEESTWYTKSKKLAEEAAWKLYKSGELKNKFDFTVINPGFIVGPPLVDDIGTSVQLAIQLMTMPMLPKMAFNSIDIRDVAEAHIRALERPETNNHRIAVTEEDPVSMKDFGIRLKKVFGPLGYSPTTGTLPQFVVKIGSFFSADMIDVLKMQCYIRFNNTKMRELLGMSPRSTLDGMVDMIDELINRGHIKKTARWEANKLKSLAHTS
ncbi:unnamed protein product, partial [Mesorhabditis belari]|uniref:NAD-dependent epimerase/dehydratase domain-containing protein n=1 Tax=Mesorhabditis belari TaxID=2138241 RepID=A0AAF3FFL5_9BILA